MLTEDIDVSLRSLIAGCRLVHDRGLVSVEIAPLQLVHWFSQRKRWAQGWLEVSLRHTGLLMRSPHFTAGQKALWFYLLVWREVYPALAVQFFPLVLTSLITGIKIHWCGRAVQPRLYEPEGPGDPGGAGGTLAARPRVGDDSARRADAKRRGRSGDGGAVVGLRGGGGLGFDGVHRRRHFRRGRRVQQRGRLGRASLAEQGGDVFMVMA